MFDRYFKARLDSAAQGIVVSLDQILESLGTDKDPLFIDRSKITNIRNALATALKNEETGQLPGLIEKSDRLLAEMGAQIQEKMLALLPTQSQEQ